MEHPKRDNDEAGDHISLVHDGEKRLVYALPVRWMIMASCWLASITALGAPVLSDSEEAATELSTREDGRLVLDVDVRYAPQTIAELIRKNFGSAQVIVDGQQIIVEGVEAGPFASAMAKLTVDPQPDDIDQLLASMRETSGPESGSGSSIRARRELDLPELKQAVRARVRTVQRQRFPLVFVGIDVLETPADAPVSAGTRIVVLPRVHSRNGLVDPDDPRSKVNVGAWYAKPGDVVEVVLEPKPDDRNIYVASVFRRKD
jgi:hypothetical protein